MCLGQAASAAAVLLAAGTPGKRLALPNARVLIHQPADRRAGRRPGVRHRDPGRRDHAHAHLARGHAGEALQPTPEQVNSDIERDKILGADEALEYGLIDQVLTSPQEPRSPRSPALADHGRSAPARLCTQEPRAERLSAVRADDHTRRAPRRIRQVAMPASVGGSG